MQEADRSLLLLAPPLIGLAIFALGRFIPRQWLAASLMILAGCTGLAIIDLSPRHNEAVEDIAAPVALSVSLAPAAPDEKPGLFGFDRWTAVYDIAAHTVYLPNGLKLEAHSGLGSRLDDPRYVHERMRGATPPNLYELTLREKPFHGVRALRLAPVDRDKVFGRSGLLAHTYMLGPKGDSNGCVVFKNYAAFLQAFDSGELKRLAVVAHLPPENIQPPAAPPSIGQEHREPDTRVAASSLTERTDGGALQP